MVKEKIKHLFNGERKIVLLGGIQASGKSTLAQEFEKAGFKRICPDVYRGIISKTKPGREHWTDAMHESDQSASKEAWDMAHREANEALKNGHSIVFDAVLPTQKSRRKLFAQLDKNKVPYYSVYNVVELQTAIDRNSNRERKVPEFVIEDKWRSQSLPMLEEGFKEVIILNNDLQIKEDFNSSDREQLISSLTSDVRTTIESMYANGELEEIFPSLYQCWGIKQDNIHHTQELHEHMICAAELIENKDPVSLISALLHDVGKSKTKEFFVKVIADNEFGFKIGEKLVAVRDTGKFGVIVKVKSFQNGGTEKTVILPPSVIEKDMNAHFYEHENVGAVMAMRDLTRLGFEKDFINEVYANILYHMDLPYKLGSNKSMRKLINKVNPKRINSLLAIRKADKLSSGTHGEDFLELHEGMIEQVNEIVKN